ncbi:hypothetical protein BC567DRAFT_237490, partial [Phyllosticta citribraziliensis]
MSMSISVGPPVSRRFASSRSSSSQARYGTGQHARTSKPVSPAQRSHAVIYLCTYVPLCTAEGGTLDVSQNRLPAYLPTHGQQHLPINLPTYLPT